MLTTSRRARRRMAAVLVAALALVPITPLLTETARAASPASATSPAPTAVDTWASAATNMAGPYTDKTVRDIVHTSIGGSDVQLRLSNAFGDGPVTFDAVYVGQQATGAAVVADTNQQATFGGSTSVTVPAGADVITDPIDMSVTPGENLAVSIHVDGSTSDVVTGHWEAEQDGWYADGDTASDESAATYTTQVEWWFWLDAVMVQPAVATQTVVALGDSITEGYASTTSANHRYPDYLAQRLLPYGDWSVANEGIGGNQVTQNGTVSGVSVQSRLARDVFSQPDVSTVIYTEGINDIGTGSVTSASQIIQADKQIIAQVHARGLKIFGGTILPYAGAGYYSAAGDQIREQVNDWIRTSGAFDGVVDFDKSMADPGNPDALNPAYDSGDHLHPNDAGYQAMANTVPLDQIVTPVATTTSLTLSPARTTTIAAAPKATVSVAADNGENPSGEITVKVGSHALTAVLNSSGQAMVTLPKLAAGSYSVTASYAGTDALARSSSASALLRVVKVAPTVAGTLSRNPVKVKRRVTLTVTVGRGSVRAASGTVRVTVSGVARTLRARVRAGRAVVTIPGFDKPGTHAIRYSYGGNAVFTASGVRRTDLHVTK